MLRKGDILFTKPKMKSRIAKIRRKMMIEVSQNEAYGHVAIYAGNGKVVEAQPIRGIFEMPLEKFLKNNDVRVFRVRGGDGEKAAEVAKKLVGRQYSLVKAIKSYFFPKKGITDPKEIKRVVEEIPKKFNKFFCSTVIVAAYPEVAKKSRYHPFDMMPVDIMDSPATQEVKNVIPKRYK